MADGTPRNILICSCEDTMPLDAGRCGAAAAARGHDRAPALPRRARKIPQGRGRRRAAHRRLHPGSAAVCRGRGRGLAAAPTSATPTSARPPAGRRTPRRPAPRWRRCIAAAAEPAPEIAFVSLESEGVILVYGRDERGDRGREPAQGSSRRHGADHAARRRRAAARHRFSGGARARSAPPRAISAPSSSWSTTTRSRRRPRAARSPSAPPKNGAVSRCDIVLDLSGGAPLFTAADLRDGYLRADPGDPAAVLRAVLKARDLVGTFDKPRYITFTDGHLRAFALAASSAATAASISARPAPSRPPAITWRSTPSSAPAAANAPPSARPAPPPMRCRRPTR